MFDRIIYIGDRTCNVKIKNNADVTFNLMNLHVIFEDQEKKILGEVDDIEGDIVKIRFLGEITKRGLLGGVIQKPTLDARIRVIKPEEVPIVTGRHKRGYMLLGKSPFYSGKDVFMNVNGFFSNHFAIFGNSGSGKSCGISRIFQNMFLDQKLFPYKSNILLFDASGEYYNAFRNLSSINPNYNYRFLTTNETDGIGERLRIPIYLLNVDDLTLLLNATSHSQIPIIERMLKLARIFSEEKVDSNAFKNHLIAKAIMTILYTNETSPNKRNEIFSIIASCSTPEFNLEAELQGIGYTRKFRDCFLIDQFGNFTESVLMTEYVSSFIKDEYDSYEPEGNVFYNLETLEKALNFTLISEGWLRNENTYADSVTIKVRLHSLITGENAKYFDYPEYVTLDQFISSLLIVNGKKYQLVNINLDDVSDDFAKVVVKVYSRLVFSFAKGLNDRASIPFHLIVEEAHRYIQNDTDNFLLGYNIFDRVAKEGRKYGVVLGLITQRPVEMSDTVISQCSNFMIFKMNHPADVDYIRKMVPNISDEIVEKQKSLQAGTCLAFGQAFTIPLIVRLEMPNPEPKSGNCDVVTIWDGNDGKVTDEDDDEEFYEKMASISEEISSNSNNREQDINTETNNTQTYGEDHNNSLSFKQEEKPNLMSITDKSDTIVSIPEFDKTMIPNMMMEPEKTNTHNMVGIDINNMPVQEIAQMPINNAIEEKEIPKIENKPKKREVEFTNGKDASTLDPSNYVNIGKQFENTAALAPNVEKEIEKPSIIIPNGQNVSNSLMEGFLGQGISIASTEADM